MKKLLFVLLLAVIFCTALPETDEDPTLEGIDWKKLWNDVKSIYQKAKQWLIDNDLYEPLINLIKKYGREAGINLELLTQIHGEPNERRQPFNFEFNAKKYAELKHKGFRLEF